MMPFRFVSEATNERGDIVVPANVESKAELLAFLAQAIPLPDYFGRNWDALEECLVDLAWLDRTALTLIHHDIPLANTPEDQRIYLEILAEAARKSERLTVAFPESCRAHVARLLPLA